ncbi:MAG: hypothetical protein DPW16_07020 [Chloroflexi bacterium]|nr:hypothetical protein [Chloroflexota bacterium]
MSQIGIWGPISSGKTTYLASVYVVIEARTQVGWRMDALPSAREFIQNTAAILAKGRFPPPTELGRNIPYYEYEISNGKKKARMAFMDAPGGLISSSDNKEYFNMLRQCHSILLMIDPDASTQSHNFGSSEENYFTTIHRLIFELEDINSKQEINFAVCITKMDLDRHWVKEKDPHGYLREIIGPVPYNKIFKRKYGKAEVFPISVAGRYSTPNGHERPNVIFLGEKDKLFIAKPDEKYWRPHKILDPLNWIFANMPRRLR